MKNWKIFLFIFAFFSKRSFPIPQIFDEITAIVNTDVILKSDIDKLMDSVNLKENLKDPKSFKVDLSRYQILERLIMDQIILQTGKNIESQILDKQIDYAISNISKMNGTSLNQILKHLKCNNISYSSYRNQIRKEILISTIINNEIRNRIIISAHELETFINQTERYQNKINTELDLSQILIPFPKNPTLDQILEMDNLICLIVKQAKDGEELNRLAVIYSTRRQTLKSENIGWIRIRDLPPALSQACSTAKKGDIIGPVRSDIGFHVMKIHDIRSQNTNLFTKEAHIRHILLRPLSTTTSDQTLTKIEKIANDIKRKKISFSLAARKFSQDLYSNSQGGDLGWLPLSVYDTTIYDALMNMKKGQISKPIRSSFGWHIIELLGIRNINKITQKKNAYRILFNRKLSEESEIWMKEKLTDTYVKILRS